MARRIGRNRILKFSYYKKAHGRAVGFLMDFVVTLRRLRHARLPYASGLKQGHVVSLRFLALALVHPCCSARLRAS